VLESCTDGLLALSAGQLNYCLRNKLAGVVVNYVLQQKLPNRYTTTHIHYCHSPTKFSWPANPTSYTILSLFSLPV